MVSGEVSDAYILALKNDNQVQKLMVSLGDEYNTLNQALSIYDQLRVGSRWFDLRVGSYEGSFIAAHVNKEMEDVPVGGPGEWLDTIIDDINK